MSEQMDVSRDPLFDALRQMWESIDPAPVDLADQMIAAIATEELDTEYELLTLVRRTSELVGTRSADHSLTVEFAYADVTVLIRVSDGADPDTRRLDGWLSPAADGQIRLAHGTTEFTAELTAGRFEIDGVPAGLVRIWFDVQDRDDLGTPTFEI